MKRFKFYFKLALVLALILGFGIDLAYADTHPKIEEWINLMEDNYIDKSNIDMDGAYNAQCVDLVNHYSQYIFGQPYYKNIGTGNGNEKYANARNDYFIKIKNVPSDPNIVPQRGDIITWNCLTYGHVAVVVSADSKNVTVIEQNVDKPYKGHGLIRKRFKKSYLHAGSYAYGWLRPRPEKMVGGVPQPEFNYPAAIYAGGHGLVRIINNHSNLVLATDGTNVLLKEFDINYPSQVWQLEKYNDKTYTLKNAVTLTYLDVSNASTANGANVQSCAWTNNPAQVWQFLGNTNDFFLKSNCAKTVLDCTENNVNSNVTMFSPHGKTNQKFSIHFLDVPTLTVSASTEDKDVNFTWNDVGENYKYELTLFDENGKAFNWISADGLSLPVQLPKGKYSARLACFKNYVTDGALSITNTVSFTVNEIDKSNQVKEEKVEEKTKTEYEAIPYKTQRISDATLATGVEKISQVGVDGKKEKIYSVTYKDGVEQSRKLIKENIVKEAIDEIIVYGTKSDKSENKSEKPKDLSNKNEANKKAIKNLSAEEKVDVILAAGFVRPAKGAGLDDTINRVESLAFIVRLMGLEEKAKLMTDTEVDAIMSHVEDRDAIPRWSRKYIAFCIREGITHGVGSDIPGMKKIDPKRKSSTKVFLTMLYRSLGYTNVEPKNVYEKTILSGLREIELDEKIAFKTITRRSLSELLYDVINRTKLPDEDGVWPTNSKLKRKLVQQGIMSDSFVKKNFDE